MRSSPNHLYHGLAAILAVSAMQTASAVPVPVPVTVTFQNGADDYFGAVDRRIGYQPNDGIAVQALAVDGGDKVTDDGDSSSILMRFEGIESAIPVGATTTTLRSVSAVNRRISVDLPVPALPVRKVL